MSGSAAVERIVGHYRILERLGRGGMGVVYKAEDLQLGRTVALKFLGRDVTRDTEARQRFVNEARAASQLDHPNICTVHEIGEDDEGELFIVMSYYEGDSLEARLQQKGAMARREAVAVTLQVARGLAAAHEHGIVHRDVKPGNVIVARDGNARLVDFGLAKLSGVSMTQTGAALGTVDYMSPEQLQGLPVTPATDVWSLGVLLFELLTATRPFSGESMGSVINSILNRDVPDLREVDRDVPPELNALLRKMLERDARDRYSSAVELLPDLQAVSDSLNGNSAPSDLSRLRTLISSGARPNPRKRVRLYVAAAAIVFVLVSAAVVFFGTRDGHAPAATRDGRTMIAVLPFENVGAAEDRFFADGVTEEIISRLAAVRELGVISRTSVYAYDRKGRSIREIGKDLGVEYVLEGTVRWEKTAKSNRVRVTPQLIRVSDDTHLWADRYERDLVEVFSVQSDIAGQVARQLGIALGQSTAGARTSSAEAYESYLRAAPARWSYDEAEIRAAVSQAQKAVAADPRFAAAHALLAQLQMRMYHHFDRSEARLSAARSSIDTSLSIEPGNADARTALGYFYYWGSLDYARAVEQWSAALRSRPGDTSALAGIAYAHRRQGKFADGLRELQELQTLDPRNRNVFAELAMTFSGLRRFDEADRVVRQGLAIAPGDTFLESIGFTNTLASGGSPATARAALEAAPAIDDEMLVASRFSLEICDRRFADALRTLQRSSVEGFVTAPVTGMWGTVRYPRELLEARALQLDGDRERANAKYEDARAVLEKERDQNPGDARIHSALGLVYAGLGLRADAVREAELAVKICPAGNDAIDGSTRLAELAQVYAQTGDEQRAVSTLERLLAVPAMFSSEFLKLDPVWDPVRRNPRFAALAQ